MIPGAIKTLKHQGKMIIGEGRRLAGRRMRAGNSPKHELDPRGPNHRGVQAQ